MEVAYRIFKNSCNFIVAILKIPEKRVIIKQAKDHDSDVPQL